MFPQGPLLARSTYRIRHGNSFYALHTRRFGQRTRPCKWIEGGRYPNARIRFRGPRPFFPPSFLFPWIGLCVQTALVTARWEEGFRCPGTFTNSESIHQGMTSRVLFRSCSDPCVDNLGDYRWHRLLRCVQSLEIVHRGINSRLMLISLILELVFDALLAKIELVPLNDHHAYARDHNDRF